jgi:hypothetical protein
MLALVRCGRSFPTLNCSLSTEMDIQFDTNNYVLVIVDEMMWRILVH